MRCEAVAVCMLCDDAFFLFVFFCWLRFFNDFCFQITLVIRTLSSKPSFPLRCETGAILKSVTSDDACRQACFRHEVPFVVNTFCFAAAHR